eukprot:tig00001486_g8921.t1
MRPAAAALLLVLAVCGLCGALASSAAGAAYQAKKPAPAEPAAAGEQLTEASPSIFSNFKLERMLEIRESSNCPHPANTLMHAESKKRIAVLVGEPGDPRTAQFMGAAEMGVSELQSALSELPAGKEIYMMQQCPDPRTPPRCTASGEPVIVAVQETLRKWGRAYTGVRERCAGEAGPARAQAPPKPAMQQAREFVERYVAAVKAYAATDQTTRLALAAIATCIVVGAAFGYQFGLREEAAPAAPPRTAPVSAPAAPAEAAGDAKKPAKGAAEAGGDVPSTPAADGDAPLESSD